jgi:acetylornithine deacetylase/succinyl-diaminopimelate desuccinylase-like protein
MLQAWFEVTITGTEAHSGSSMAGRRHAMVVASTLIAAVERRRRPNEAEEITRDWASAGLQVLADAVLETAGLVR